MKKLTIKMLALAFFVLLCAPVAMAQVRTIVRQFSSPGISSVSEIINLRVTFSTITWLPDGPITSCSFKMEKSDDGVTWTDLTSLQDCTSSGKLEIITPLLGKFIRVNVPTVAGGGFISVFWEGFKGTGCGLDYRGIFSVEKSPDPAPGTELTITIPATERWRVYSARFELQTNSTAGDREVFLSAALGSDEYFRVFADGVVKSDQLGIFTGAALGFVGTAGLGPASINQPTDVRTVLIPIYSEDFIPGGHTLSTDTNGLEVGDDYSSAAVLVERCPN